MFEARAAIAKHAPQAISNVQKILIFQASKNKTNKRKKEKKKKENPSRCPLERPHFSASEHSELTWDEWWAERLFCYFFTALSLICTHTHAPRSYSDLNSRRLSTQHPNPKKECRPSPSLCCLVLRKQHARSFHRKVTSLSLRQNLDHSSLSCLTQLHFPMCLSNLLFCCRVISDHRLALTLFSIFSLCKTCDGTVNYLFGRLHLKCFYSHYITACRGAVDLIWAYM